MSWYYALGLMITSGLGLFFAYDRWFAFYRRRGRERRRLQARIRKACDGIDAIAAALPTHAASGRVPAVVRGRLVAARRLGRDVLVRTRVLLSRCDGSGTADEAASAEIAERIAAEYSDVSVAMTVAEAMMQTEAAIIETVARYAQSRHAVLAAGFESLSAESAKTCGYARLELAKISNAIAAALTVQGDAPLTVSLLFRAIARLDEVGQMILDESRRNVGCKP